MSSYMSNSRPDFTPFKVNCGEIPAYRFTGTLKTELAAGGLTTAQAIDLLEDMLIVREVEEMIVRLRSGAYEPIRDFNYRGPTHVSVGQEGSSVGVCSTLRPGDYITTTHRGHGDSIARGCIALRTMPDDQLRKRLGGSASASDTREQLLEKALEDHVYRTIAELFGKEDGYCRGRGGSMHIADFSVGHLGANAIVGGNVPIATGAALGLRYLRSGGVVCCFAGDGAYSNGVVLESLNFAAQRQFSNELAERAFGLPIIFLVVNNHYGMTGRADNAAIRAGGAPDPVSEDVIRYMYTTTASTDVPPPHAQVEVSQPLVIKRVDGELTYRDAIKEALYEEMKRDRRVIFYGEDVAEYGGAFEGDEGPAGSLRSRPCLQHPDIRGGDLRNRCRRRYARTQTSRGVDVYGLHADGVRPDQQPGGQVALYVGRAIRGPARHPRLGRRRQGIRRTAFADAGIDFSHVPGLYVVYPSTPADAKGLLKSSIRDNNPIMYVESQLLYGVKGQVPDGDHLVPLGKADVKRAGKDITLVTWGPAVVDALKAAEHLAVSGAQAEVIDLRCLVPLDMETVYESVRKTGRRVIASHCVHIGSFTAEVAARIQEEVFDYLDAPVLRVDAKDGIAPQSHILEAVFLPTAGDIVAAAQTILYGLAVALDEGLVVPVVRNADQLTVEQIATLTKGLVKKARAAMLRPEEMTGSSFTISNLGMLNVEHFTAIINPGESAILAVSSAKAQPVAIKDSVAIRRIMKMTLSADHRLVDGALAARFLNAIKDRLEQFREEPAARRT